MWVCRRTPCSRAISAVRRIRSSLTEKGAQGARATRVRAPGRGSWCSRISRSESARMAASSWQHSSGGRPPWLRPRLIEPRVGWKRMPSSRAARDLDVDEARLAAGEEVEVVGRGGAAGQQQLGEAHPHGGVHGRPVPAHPDVVELGQPAEQRRLLHARHVAGQDLGQVVVGVDQARQGHLAARVDHALGLVEAGRRRARAHSADPAVFGVQPAVAQARAGVVHDRQQPGPVDQQSHAAAV